MPKNKKKPPKKTPKKKTFSPAFYAALEAVRFVGNAPSSGSVQ